jgi:hypothetical protein
MQSSAQVSAQRMGVYPLPDGTELVLCSFNYGDWQHVKREALASYKRARIKTWTDNVDLMPEDMRQEAIREAFRRAENITVDTLPTKQVKVPDESGELQQDEMDYVSWWLSETDDGKFFALWLSARHAPGQEQITRDEIVNKLHAHPLDLEMAAQEVGKMSQSELAKNSSSPETGPQPTREQVPTAMTAAPK